MGKRPALTLRTNDLCRDKEKTLTMQLQVLNTCSKTSKKAEAKRTESKHSCSDHTPTSSLRRDLLHLPARWGCFRGSLFTPHLASAFFVFLVLRNANFHHFVSQETEHPTDFEWEKSGVSNSCSLGKTGKRRADVGHLGQASGKCRACRRANVWQMLGKRRARFERWSLNKNIWRCAGALKLRTLRPATEQKTAKSRKVCQRVSP